MPFFRSVLVDVLVECLESTAEEIWFFREDDFPCIELDSMSAAVEKSLKDLNDSEKYK